MELNVSGTPRPNRKMARHAREDRIDDEDDTESSDQENMSAEVQEGTDLAQQFYAETIRRKGPQEQEAVSSSTTSVESSSQPTPKFTGGSLFSDSSSVNTSSQKSPYEQEIDLASIFQRTLPLQAAALAASIAFVVYVGFSGGITDGSERSFAGFDEIDEVTLDIYNIRGDDQAEIDAAPPSPFGLSPDGGVYL